MASDKQLMMDDQAAAFKRLRRLQEHNRSNIPAMMMQKAMGSFTLHEAEQPQQALEEVSVVVYPQDPFVGDPEVRSMNARDIQPGLVNSRVLVADSAGAGAQPDDEGNYMYWPGTVEFDQVNAFYYTTFTLRMFERYARRTLPWSFPTPRLVIDPHVGDGANAFYHEDDRMVGFHRFEANGKTVVVAQSADVVSHECAHAVLDGMRDLYNESFGLGPMAFHESFGDMAAMLVALHDDSLLKRVLEWTDGDLRLDNFVAALAEHMTDSLMQASGGRVHGHTVYLRNALNNLRAAPFDELSYRPEKPATQLGRQSHNYSRLFTGTFYDILIGIYEQLQTKIPQQIALHRARDIAGHVLVSAVELGPVGEFDFSDMAKAFLIADTILHDGQYGEVMARVFEKRGLLGREASEATVKALRELPTIQLPKTVNTGLAAALFYEEVAAPALNMPPDLEMVPVGAYRNAAGQAFLTYFTHREIELVGAEFAQFDGSHIDAFGGLTLMFDRAGFLRSAFFRPVSDEDVRQIQILTRELVEFGLIAEQMVPPDTVGGRKAAQGPLHMQPDVPQGLWLPDVAVNVMAQAAGRGNKLVKFPAVFDTVPDHAEDLRDYLRAVQGQEL